MSGKVIIFDLGKVIFDYDLNIISKSLSEYSPKKELFEDIDAFIYTHKDLFFTYEKGLISSSDFYKEFLKLVEIKDLPYDKFCDIWNDIFTPIQDVMDLVISLAHRYELALLSNTNELHFDYLYKKYSDFFMNFKKLHLSHIMNARKPDAEIYEQVLKYHNVEPQNMFFTDDNKENVYAAMAMGIKAFSFKNIIKLRQDLECFGIEV
ncbi:MAG: HAD family phosphatase [Elusimicrobia bacterium]|nr:HAD family phosphatase [Elusimicrobiota bacterium]